MAKDIQLKRGNLANLPVEGLAGEPIITLDSRELFIGTGAGTPLKKVSDVEFVATKADLKMGLKGKIYVVEADETQTGTPTTMYRFNGASFDLIGGGEVKFSDLIDVEAYTGKENQALVVNSDASGLTYVDVATQVELDKVKEDLEAKDTANATIAKDATKLVEDELIAFKETKGKAEGLASLDETGKVPVTQIPSIMKEGTVVANIDARDAILGENRYKGLRVFVIDATADITVDKGAAEYVYDGTDFIKISESESLDLVLDWENLKTKPTSTIEAIDGAVEKATHTNRDSLDKLLVDEVSKTLTVDGQKLIDDATAVNKNQTWSSDMIRAEIDKVSTSGGGAVEAEKKRAEAAELVLTNALAAEELRADTAEKANLKVTTDHIADVANPHNVSVNLLTDTNITELKKGEFLEFDGTEWINTNVLDGGTF